MQIWHMGRTVLPEFASGERPVAPSEVKAEGGIRGQDGTKHPFVMPRVITIPEIKETVADFSRAALRAVEAGFDGIEIHGANNFLVDSFLRDGTNRREDEYGGPIENRARFLIEVVDAVTGAIGEGRVGVRLSPSNSYFGITDSEPHKTFPGVAAMLNGFDLAYLHVLEQEPAGDMAPVAPLIRAAYTGTLVRNGGYDHHSGNQALDAGEADAIAFGVPFIANPDLVERYRLGLPLTDSDPETYYTPGRRGYADYPAYMAEAS
jgi:N-ethylmaleimide reductase